MEQFGGACTYCGTANDLVFHHLPGQEKVGNVGTMVGHGVAWEKVLAEARKCILLCRSCHGKHHGRRTPQHGTLTTYAKGCRCPACRQAQQAYYREYRRKWCLG